MGTSYHIDCYQNATGKTARAWRARKNSKCAAGEECLHGGFVYRGQEYTWSRRDSSTDEPKATETETETETETANETETENQESVIMTESPAQVPNVTGDAIGSALAAVLVPAVLPIVRGEITKAVDALKGSVNPDEIIAKVLAKCALPTTVEIKQVDGSTKDLGIQHKQFPVLLKALAAGCNVWLAGPSGSGKTTAAKAAAKALDLPFYYTGAVNDAATLMGYCDVNGRYVRTLFREAYENGGVFLWDEVDASDPGALLAFNAALENGSAAFPDAIVHRHEKCIIIAAANTYGHGATHEYVGRLKLDAAFLKRFAFLAWDYDQELELATAPNQDWTRRVQQIRERVRKAGLRVLVTPRESYIGGRLLAAGLDRATVEQMTVRSGMTDEQWAKVAS